MNADTTTQWRELAGWRLCVVCCEDSDGGAQRACACWGSILRAVGPWVPCGTTPPQPPLAHDDPNPAMGTTTRPVFGRLLWWLCGFNFNQIIFWWHQLLRPAEIPERRASRLPSPRRSGVFYSPPTSGPRSPQKAVGEVFGGRWRRSGLQSPEPRRPPPAAESKPQGMACWHAATRNQRHTRPSGGIRVVITTTTLASRAVSAGH